MLLVVFDATTVRFVVEPGACLPKLAGDGESWTSGSMVTRARPPTALFSVNQMLPSGPTAMPVGWTLPEKAPCVGTGNLV